MKTKMWIRLALTAALAFGLGACSDEPEENITNPPATDMGGGGEDDMGGGDVDMGGDDDMGGDVDMGPETTCAAEAMPDEFCKTQTGSDQAVCDLEAGECVPYVAVALTCAEDVEPMGDAAELIGTWEVSDVCLGTNPLAAAATVCPGAIFTALEVSSASGFLHLNDTRYTSRFVFDGVVEAFIPTQCLALAGGTCDGLEMAISTTLVPGSTPNCMDVDGGCYCDVTAAITQYGAGAYTATGAGVLTLNHIDGSNAAMQTWEFNYDGVDGVQLQVTGDDSDNTAYTASRAANDAGLCQLYCANYQATCDPIEGVEKYASWDACMTACAAFPVSGDDTATTGDSVECRLYHVRAAGDPANPDNVNTHCPHAQPTATAPCAD